MIGFPGVCSLKADDGPAPERPDRLVIAGQGRQTGQLSWDAEAAANGYSVE